MGSRRVEEKAIRRAEDMASRRDRVQDSRERATTAGNTAIENWSAGHSIRRWPTREKAEAKASTIQDLVTALRQGKRTRILQESKGTWVEKGISRF